jgi:hypothetical protein
MSEIGAVIFTPCTNETSRLQPARMKRALSIVSPSVPRLRAAAISAAVMLAIYVSPFPAKTLDLGLDQFGEPGNLAV